MTAPEKTQGERWPMVARRMARVVVLVVAMYLTSAGVSWCMGSSAERLNTMFACALAITLAYRVMKLEDEAEGGKQ